MQDTADGDPDTVYSIALLFADSEFDDGGWYDHILKELTEKYPSFS
jgi:hypothetical protein